MGLLAVRFHTITIIYTNGWRPAKPVSISCQNCMLDSPKSQHRYTSRPSQSVGKSTSPRSKSFNSMPASFISCARFLNLSTAASVSLRLSTTSWSVSPWPLLLPFRKMLSRSSLRRSMFLPNEAMS